MCLECAFERYVAKGREIAAEYRSLEIVDLDYVGAWPKTNALEYNEEKIILRLPMCSPCWSDGDA